jgi:SAM-dependent methyltransferase
MECMEANHVDPMDPAVPAPDPSQWPVRRQELFRSDAMAAFRAGMLRPGCTSIRESVIADLTEYSGLDESECIHRATHSQFYANLEWGDLPRNPTPAELASFYQQNNAWVFGLLWYSYLQAEGYAWPAVVSIGNDLDGETGARSILDFGAGVGAGAMMFTELGHTVSAADISDPLLRFVKYRSEQRRQELTVIDLNVASPEPAAFDVVCAVQTMAHVPDVGATAAMLHASLRSDGLLFADFDTRERKRGDSRLYDDDLTLRRLTQARGFVQERVLDEGVSIRYRRVDPHGLVHAGRRARDHVTLGLPRRVYRRLRTRR